ncbi:MAG: hypothetical protein CYG60_05705 [Actinobacteria bacterium]|nr:MAG: hypothetical protein CYG60_05705 [Actinomycetota bacterium]
MSVTEIVAVLLAGVGAGAINAVVGSGTLFTFPVLLSLGFPPVTATMSNAIGLVPGSVSGTWGYRKELAGQRRRVLRLVPASLLGAITGAWLLLHLPAETFEAVVPVLLALALVLVVTQTRIQRALARRRERRAEGGPQSGERGPVTFVATYLIGCYGGYFAAAQGILLVGALGSLIPEALQRLNALKNLLALVVNTVAASTYAIVAYDRVSWTAAGLIAAGSLVGGFVGAGVGRRLSPAILRGVIVVLGIVGIWRILGG